MAYIKQNFEDGQVLKAEHLNNMEEGIGGANDTLDALKAAGGVGYSESNRVAAVKPQTVEAVTIEETHGDGGSTYWMARAIASAPIMKGDKLTVIWDGAEYKATARATEDFGDVLVRFPGIIFGLLVGDPDIPITVNYNPDSTELFIVVSESMLGDHTVAIYKDTEIVHAIDQKYIPAETVDTVADKLSAKGQIGGEDIIERIELSESRQTVATTQDIVGATITEYVEGRRKFILPKQRPKVSGGEVGTEFRTTASGSKAFLGMLYGTYEGYLTKPCFMFTGELLYTTGCPFFWNIAENLATYDSLLYAYEDTPDALGLGLTFTKGWHALSSTTFANKPLEEDECPIFIFDAMGVFNAGTSEAMALFEACFQPYETAEFEVKPENKLPRRDGYYQIINADVSKITEVEPFLAYFANFVAPVTWNEYGVTIDYSTGVYGADMANSTATITWSEPKPIDAKYLPEPLRFGSEHKIYTYDGNHKERLAIPFPGEAILLMVRISDDSPKLEGFRRIALSDGTILTSEQVQSADFPYGNEFGVTGQFIPMPISSNIPIVASVTGTMSAEFPTGLYVVQAAADSGSYVSEVDLGDIIEPIEPKYLPYNYGRKILFEGKPPKVDLTSYGLGTVYQIEDGDIFPNTEGQDIHYIYEVNSKRKSGVMHHFTYAPNIQGMTATDTVSVGIAYSDMLGFSAFAGVTDTALGVDLGDITYLCLWIEYRYDKPYIIRSYRRSNEIYFIPFSQEKAINHAINGSLEVRDGEVGSPLMCWDAGTYGINGDNKRRLGLIYCRGYTFLTNGGRAPDMVYVRFIDGEVEWLSNGEE